MSHDFTASLAMRVKRPIPSARIPIDRKQAALRELGVLTEKEQMADDAARVLLMPLTRLHDKIGELKSKMHRSLVSFFEPWL